MEADRNIKSLFDAFICLTYLMFAISLAIYILHLASELLTGKFKVEQKESNHLTSKEDLRVIHERF